MFDPGIASGHELWEDEWARIPGETRARIEEAVTAGRAMKDIYEAALAYGLAIRRLLARMDDFFALARARGVSVQEAMAGAELEARDANWRVIKHLWRNLSRRDRCGRFIEASLEEHETKTAEGLAYFHSEPTWRSRSPTYVLLSQRRLLWRPEGMRTRTLDRSDITGFEISDGGRRFTIRRVGADPLRIEFSRAGTHAAVALRALLMR